MENIELSNYDIDYISEILKKNIINFKKLNIDNLNISLFIDIINNINIVYNSMYTNDTNINNKIDSINYINNNFIKMILRIIKDKSNVIFGCLNIGTSDSFKEILNDFNKNIQDTYTNIDYYSNGDTGILDDFSIKNMMNNFINKIFNIKDGRIFLQVVDNKKCVFINTDNIDAKLDKNNLLYGIYDYLYIKDKYKKLGQELFYKEKICKFNNIVNIIPIITPVNITNRYGVPNLIQLNGEIKEHMNYSDVTIFDEIPEEFLESDDLLIRNKIVSNVLDENDITACTKHILEFKDCTDLFNTVYITNSP